MATAAKEQRKKTAAEIERQRLHEMKAMQRKEEAAAIYIQQRMKIKLARKLAQKKKKANAMQGQSAATLLVHRTTS